MPSDSLITWLMQADTPSIRYLTLQKLRPAADREAQFAFTEMGEHGPIPAILSNQTETGAWQGEHSFYTPKYKSTHWSMLLLSELAADPSAHADAPGQLGATRYGSDGGHPAAGSGQFSFTHHPSTKARR